MIYTDFIGNPIAVGDTIVYPTCSGSSSAEMNMAVVEEILDLTPHRPQDLSKFSAYLQSDLRKAHPPQRTIATRFIADDPQPAGQSRWFRAGKYERDDSKAYALRVRKTRDGYKKSWSPQDRLVMLKNVERVVVVTGMVNN